MKANIENATLALPTKSHIKSLLFFIFWLCIWRQIWQIDWDGVTNIIDICVYAIPVYLQYTCIMFHSEIHSIFCRLSLIFSYTIECNENNYLSAMYTFGYDYLSWLTVCIGSIKIIHHIFKCKTKYRNITIY